jgi:hypothetical protein
MISKYDVEMRVGLIKAIIARTFLNPQLWGNKGNGSSLFLNIWKSYLPCCSRSPNYWNTLQTPCFSNIYISLLTKKSLQI